ncbi:hypothetical protein [Mitsuokella multacida]|uniref:hypothetical protein n=2 Tax=Mitsuokella multacida TaxID=52226 RepID=UPI0022DF551B|nr:hypothetical protein [Mitsuokella multacida]
MSYLLDVLLLMMLIFEMTFFYLPPVLHEAVGVGLLLPIIWHLMRNRRYVSSLGRGRWNGPRGVRFILNVLLASACLVTVISGCLTSSMLFADIVPFSLRSNPSLYQLHGTAAHYFLVLAGLHLGWHLPAWWQRWLHAAGITARPLPARMLLLGLGVLLGAGGIYAAQQDILIERLQGAHIFMAPALSYSGAGYALTQVGIIIVFAEIGWLLSLWKGARLK